MPEILTALAPFSAAGNAFHVWDGFITEPPADPGRLAAELCRESGRDGLLLALPDAAADVRMVVHNADGTRAETCGNGLRCLAKLVGDKSGAEAIDVRTDTGLSRVELVREAGSVVGGAVDMGAHHTLEHARLDLDGRVLAVVLVDVGNPHCVLLGVDPRELPRLGPRLEAHPRFRERTNVELAVPTPDGIRARVFERGVGETRSCGSGACAVALAAVDSGLTGWPVAVQMPGGRLEVDLRYGHLRLAGPVERG